MMSQPCWETEIDHRGTCPQSQGFLQDVAGEDVDVTITVTGVNFYNNPAR